MTVTATGTLSAVTTVQVGSQVSGVIARLYADFNSRVTKGQLLAELDPTPFQQQVEQRQADLTKSRVEAANARISYDRALRLVKAGLSPQADLDSARAAYEGANAQVQQSTAALNQSLTNLKYTKIISPIDGIVVDRQYDVGQTVAASFPGADALLDRPGPDQDAGAGRRRSVRHRPHRRRTDRALHRRLLSRSGVPRPHLADPPQRHGQPERRHVSRDHRSAESRREAAAEDDRERHDRRGHRAGRASHPERRAAIQTRHRPPRRRGGGARRATRRRQPRDGGGVRKSRPRGSASWRHGRIRARLGGGLGGAAGVRRAPPRAETPADGLPSGCRQQKAPRGRDPHRHHRRPLHAGRLRRSERKATTSSPAWPHRRSTRILLRAAATRWRRPGGGGGRGGR